jgi:hypothetical protein
MSVTNDGWSNKSGTSDRSCKCGTWKEHWINFSNKAWPTNCSVKGCTNKATLGAHVINASVTGERIIPMCNSCNSLSGTFSLNGGTGIPSANISKTCGKN